MNGWAIKAAQRIFGMVNESIRHKYDVSILGMAAVIVEEHEKSGTHVSADKADRGKPDEVTSGD